MTKLSTLNYQSTQTEYIIDHDIMQVFSLDATRRWYESYKEDAETTNCTYEQYLRLITDGNGTCDIIMLNSDSEMILINQLLADGEELEDCIEAVNNENCLNGLYNIPKGDN